MLRTTTAPTLHFPCRLRLLLKCDMATNTSSLEAADVVGNLIAQIIYDAIYNSHADIDDIKKSVNAYLQLNQEVLESLYRVKENRYKRTLHVGKRVEHFIAGASYKPCCRLHTRNSLRRFRRLGRAETDKRV